ncbi:tetratricopeptide repeat protein [Roseiconus nitratireducens]|uniref:tetratricopeptide repeat protein n=1 Tax=Roseiconus nitratireducens TaxID=2605748 RepID=UPI0013759FB9|nr:tetratricopeptide repeat protein [Roseiconus nitratireducens]
MAQRNHVLSRESSPFRGKRIALTGRFASMDRGAVRRLIVALGATPTDHVSRRTSVLVVGSDGWPLKRSGQPTRNLRRAANWKRKGYPLEIINEATFLERVGVSEIDHGLRRLYTVEQISDMVQVSGLRIRRWVEAGLIAPKEVRHGVPMFSFQQIASIRDLWRMLADGCSLQTLAINLGRIRRLLPDSDGACLEVQRLGQALVARGPDGTLIEGNGQRRFSFEAFESDVACLDESVRWDESVPRQTDPDVAFALATTLETADPERAIDAYQNWLDRFGSDPAALFNLANLLRASGQIETAVACYRRSLSVDSTRANVWNNYALSLADLGRLDEATRAIENAIDQDREYADAYFNAADILEERGQFARARLMWRQYLQFDGETEHGRYARDRCQRGVISTVDER